MEGRINDELSLLMASLNEDGAFSCAKRLIKEGVSTNEIAGQLIKGLDIVGEMYSNKEYFLADLVLSGIIAKQIFAMLQSLESGEIPTNGVVILGTIQEDIHDIGKDLIVNALRTMGMKVIDLGVDVKPEEFIFAAKQYQADIVAVSCVMSSSVNYLNKLGNLLHEEGLLQHCHYIIGGAVVNQYLSVDYSDFMCCDMMEGIQCCIKALGTGKREN